MDLKKENWKILILACGFISSLGLAIFKYYFNKSEFTDEEFSIIKEIKEKFEENKSELDKEIVSMIMNLSIRKNESTCSQKYQNLTKQRRIYISDGKAYKNIVSKILKIQNDSLQNTLDHILTEVRIDYTEFKTYLNDLPKYEVERNIGNYNQPNGIIDIRNAKKEIVIEAFIYYGYLYVNYMKNFKKIMYKINENDLFLEMLTLKCKCDDELFLKYGYTESQLRLLIFKLHIFDEPEIKNVEDKILLNLRD